MKPLQDDPSDESVIEFLDGWAALLEAEDYAAAFTYTDHVEATTWTPELIREVIKSYGEAAPTQVVTLRGEPTDISQHKEVDRWPPDSTGCFGEVWYDLNIDGYASDLTATFDLVRRPGGVSVQLNEIHVM